MQLIISLLQSAIWFGTIILFGALGELLTEKTGNLNLGVPGIMALGAVGALVGAFFYEMYASNPSTIICLIVTLLAAMAFALVGGLIYGFLTISLRANQNVTGLTLTIFGVGFANFLGGSLNKLVGGVGQISLPISSNAFRAILPFLKNVPVFNTLGWLVYLAIVCAIVMNWFLNKTRTGLNLRAVGENPATADAAGINVIKYKYMSIIISSCLSGLGGLYYTMDYIKGTWASDGALEALGWLALALVIFARWKPLSAFIGSYIFGVLNWLYFYFSGLCACIGIDVTISRGGQELFKMLPYLTTIIVLVVVSMRNSRDSQPPASLGLSYFREDR